MKEVFDMLAQQTGTGSLEQVYMPVAGENIIIREIRVLNPTGGVGSFQIYHKKVSIVVAAVLGDTNIEWVASLPAKARYTDKSHIGMVGDSGGAIAWAATVGLVITVYGVIIT